MSRYFFHVMDGHFCHDAEGVECADMAAVRQAAVSSAGAMLRDMGDADGASDWQMVVASETGQVVLKLGFTVR
jgi:hypothetical protein